MGFWQHLVDQRTQRRIGQAARRVDDFRTTWENESDDMIKARWRHLIATSHTPAESRQEKLALVAVMAHRSLGLRPFLVQLMGSLAMMDGKITQMRTGEGKTLTAMMAAVVLASEGLPVHVVTVNDYLAKRDAGSAQKLAQSFDMSVGLVIPEQSPADKKKAYACSVVYGTNSEIGFDVLRDQMVLRPSDRCMRGLGWALIDEIDSILIDEARTPLIISGPGDGDVDLWNQMNGVARTVFEQHRSHHPLVVIDEKMKQVALTEDGIDFVEHTARQYGLLPFEDSLFSAHNIFLSYYLQSCLLAHGLYHRNVDYLVDHEQVKIVDEFTGRVLPGRRWGQGLHQAVEAKEGVRVVPEDHTLATITLQNLFRSYAHLAGMTGTALGEREEFAEVYGLDVVVIPTHLPMIRHDEPDRVFLTASDKMNAVIEEIARVHATGQPLLVGTSSVVMSDHVSKALEQLGIAHHVLNAKQHEREAHIIAQAGRTGAVTIATNMAGRGTDIVLGGEVGAYDTFDLWQQEHDRVVALGGLRVIGTERHESSRVDDQLRGRAGRQGDPGSSAFFVSFEDNLLRVFAPSWATGALRGMGMGQGNFVGGPLVDKQIARAQRAVEQLHRESRRQLLLYDDIINLQRTTMVAWRDGVLDDTYSSSDVTSWLRELLTDFLHDLLVPELAHNTSVFKTTVDILRSWSWDGHRFEQALIAWQTQQEEGTLAQLTQTWDDLVVAMVQVWWDRLVEQQGEDRAIAYVRDVVVTRVDKAWRAHMGHLDVLRSGIHLRSFAQKQPELEFRQDAFAMFDDMMRSALSDVVDTLAAAGRQPSRHNTVRLSLRASWVSQWSVGPEHGHASWVGVAPSLQDWVSPVAPGMLRGTGWDASSDAPKENNDRLDPSPPKPDALQKPAPKKVFRGRRRV